MPRSRQLSLAVVMDPIAKIKFAKDSTLAMLLAAQRSWLAAHVLRAVGPVPARRRGPGPRAPLEVSRRSRRVVRARRAGRAGASAIRLRDSCARIRRSTPSTSTPPTSSSARRSAGRLVANRPQGLRDMNEKVFTAWFPQCCAPTLITRDTPPTCTPSSPSTARSWSSRWTAWAASRSSSPRRATRTCP